MTRASASHPAMLFAFNVASQGAQSALPARTHVSLHQLTANGSRSEAAMSG
jgi:hypothetical protein